MTLTFQIVSDMTATPDKDLGPAAGSVTFEPGEAMKSLKLKLCPDEEPENDEIFTVQLTGTLLVLYHFTLSLCS